MRVGVFLQHYFNRADNKYRIKFVLTTTLRRVVVKDDTEKRQVFLINNFTLKPELIADLYRQRWQVELFFKWIR